MGRIKSALELALEKTSEIKSDKASISQFDAKQRGKKFANEYLEKPDSNISDYIGQCPAEERQSLKQGLFETLISQITLPSSKNDEERIENAGKGLTVLINNNKFNSLFKQVVQLLTQFLEEAGQFEEHLKRQYAPKLRQKEEEMSRRMGREIRIDPLQDPEFIQFFNQNVNALKANYQNEINLFKEEARRFFKN
ncbi:MAG: hypothetical protein FWF29_04830 [Treponema sp.]|nr:hypothetical protein [Treponema sp.]